MSIPNTEAYPALHEMLDYYTLSVSRALDKETRSKYGYYAYVEPSFGAASGIYHEVWAETFTGALDKIEASCAEWFGNDPGATITKKIKNVVEKHYCAVCGAPANCYTDRGNAGIIQMLWLCNNCF